MKSTPKKSEQTKTAVPKDANEAMTLYSKGKITIKEYRAYLEKFKGKDKTPAATPKKESAKVTSKDEARVIALIPPKYTLNHYNYKDDKNLVAVFIRPDVINYFIPLGIINDRPLLVGHKEKNKDLFTDKNNLGRWWLGTLVEQEASWAFFPYHRVDMKEFEALKGESIKLEVLHANRENLDNAKLVYGKRIKSPGYKFSHIYKRPEEKPSPKVNPVKEKTLVSKAKVEPDTVDAKLKLELKKVETIKQLDKFIENLPKGYVLVNRTSGTELKKYEKIKGKTENETVKWNTDQGVFRVYMVSKLFVAKKK